MSDDELDDLDADELRQRLRMVTAERDTWRRKFEQLDQWRAWVLQVARLETEQLSPAAKVAAFTLWPELQSRKERGIAELAAIWIEDLATHAGLSPGTYGKKLKELAEVGALVREETKDPVTGHSKVLIAPAAFEHPDTWAPSAPRNHGGEREPDQRPAPACATCGPEAPVVQERTVITRTLCATCDTELAEHTFTQTRTTIWSPDDHGAGCSDVRDHETPNRQVAGWPDELSENDLRPYTNHQGAGHGDRLSLFVPHVAGWGTSPATQGAATDRSAQQERREEPDVIASLPDDVASPPGVQATLITPDDPPSPICRRSRRVTPSSGRP